jgi:hypothetical protein
LFAQTDLGVSEPRSVLAVPEDAVVQRADGAVVFRVGESERVERVHVVTGVIREGWIEIRSGLQRADVVVVRGQTRLDDGVMVSVRHADGQPVNPSSVEAGGEALASGSPR